MYFFWPKGAMEKIPRPKALRTNRVWDLSVLSVSFKGFCFDLTGEMEEILTQGTISNI